MGQVVMVTVTVLRGFASGHGRQAGALSRCPAHLLLRRERERQRETERDRDRDRDRETETETDRQTDRQTDSKNGNQPDFVLKRTCIHIPYEAASSLLHFDVCGRKRTPQSLLVKLETVTPFLPLLKRPYQ